MKKINKTIKQKRPSKNENLTRLELLTTYDEFQDDVKELRKLIGLPPNGLGFEADREAERSAWFRRFEAFEQKREAKAALKKLDDEMAEQIDIIDRQIELHKRFAKIGRELMMLQAHNTHRIEELYASEGYKSLRRDHESIKAQLDPAAIKPEFFREKQRKNWEQKIKILSQIPENLLSDSIDWILQRYSQPASLADGIDMYIKFNRIFKLPIKNYSVKAEFSAVTRWIGDEVPISEHPGDTPVITVQIFKPLKSREVNQLAKEISQLQREVFPRGLLKTINPAINLEKITALAQAASDTRHTAGRPKKREAYMDSFYVQSLQKQNGYSDDAIRKTMRERRKVGERIDAKKHKIEKTTSPEERSAKHKLKTMHRKYFPPPED